MSLPSSGGRPRIDDNHRRRLATRACALVGVIVLGACGTTTTTAVDTEASSATPLAAAPLPTSTNEQLLEMVQLTTNLGQLIADGDDAEAVARLEALWVEASPVVANLEPALGREVEHQLGIIRTGVERNRPADTDKAARNLERVVASYVEQHP
jgi:hypothetical protein